MTMTTPSNAFCTEHIDKIRSWAHQQSESGVACTKHGDDRSEDTQRQSGLLHPKRRHHLKCHLLLSL